MRLTDPMLRLICTRLSGRIVLTRKLALIRRKVSTSPYARFRWLLVIVLAGGIAACSISTASSPPPAPSTPSVDTSSALGTPTPPILTHTALPLSTPSPLPTEPTGVPTVQQSNRRSDCSRLSSLLVELLNSPNPEDFATQRGLRYENGRVLVEVTLSAPADDLAQKYDLIMRGSVGTPPKVLVSVFAPLNTLCDLSNDPRVLAVRRPIQVVPSTS